MCHVASVVVNYLSAVESDDSDDGSNQYSHESEGASEYEDENDVMIVEQNEGIPANEPANKPMNEG